MQQFQPVNVPGNRVGGHNQALNAAVHHRNLPYVFTDPTYPVSLSLRDPKHINPWRHHLCNGPWLGCYENGRCLSVWAYPRTFV